MRLNIRTTILVITVFLTGIMANAQNISLDLRNVTVQKSISALQKQSGYSFVFASEDLDTKKIINVKADDLESAITQIIAGQGLTYEIDGKKVILKKIASPSQTSGNGKRMVIAGKVTDPNGDGIPGAVVQIKSRNEGVSADLDGNFSIEASSGETVDVSSLGYLSGKFIVSSRNRYDIVLQEDRKVIDEAVVIGYGTTTRKNLTTAISTVNPDKISKAAVSNMSSLLLGRAAGVQSNVSSPQPDGYVNVSIRGGSTPVYVVDGIVMPSSSIEQGSSSSYLPSSVSRSGMAGLNPEDIESIEILKDASAAIYGIGASDGVIIITTKKGKAGRPKVTYSGSYSVMNNTRTMKVLDAQQFMELTNAFSKERYYYQKGVYPYGTNAYDGAWTPEYTNEYMSSNTIDTDWSKEVLRTGSINNQNVNIQGGTDKLKYYLGLNYFDQKGTVYNSGMKRYVIRTNVTAQLFPFLQLATTLNYNDNSYTNSSVGADQSGGHTYGAYQAAVTYPPVLAAKDEDGEYTMFSNIPNPAALLKINDNTEKNTVYANFTANLDIIKNMLVLKGVYGMNKEMVDRKYYIPSTVYYNQTYTSRGQVGSTKQTNQTFEATLDFHHKFGDIVDLSAMAGVGRYFVDYYASYFYFTNSNDAIGTDYVDIAGGPNAIHSGRAESEKRSQFARVSADFLDRYVVSATLRRDGTDKFFPNKKYSMFPSVSVAWKITGEPFMKNVSFVNLLKLRASYGKTGRDNLGTSLYGIYSTGKYVSFDEGKTMYLPYVLTGEDYDDVSWETTEMKDVALDFSIFKNRIWGSIDLYRDDETNQLLYENSSWKDMFVSRPVNDGHYKRQGVEINVNSKNVQTKDFSWTTTLNWSRNQTTWVKRVANYDYAKYQQRENEPVSYLYYYKTDGIICSDKSNMPESQKSLDASWQQPGVKIIVDKNGDGIINEEDVYLRNTGDPDFYYGFGNTFTWKHWDLDIYCYGRVGFTRYNYALGYGNYYSLLALGRNIGLTAYESYNSITNPNGSLTGYAWSQVSSLPSSLGTDNCQEDASFLRIRNITLGYTFDSKQLRFFKGNVNSIRIYADVQNPYVFTNFTMIDPEISLGGGQSTVVNYPQARTFSFGAKVEF